MKKKKKIITGILLIVVLLIVFCVVKNYLKQKQLKEFLNIQLDNITYQIGESSVRDFVRNGWGIKNKDLKNIPQDTCGTVQLVKDNKVIVVIWNNSSGNRNINDVRVCGVCINKTFNVKYKLSEKSEELYQTMSKKFYKTSSNKDSIITMKKTFYNGFISLYYDRDEIITVGLNDISIGVSKGSFEIE